MYRLTFIEETANGVSLKKMWVLGNPIHIRHRVVQVEHVLRRLFVAFSKRGVIHPKYFQKLLDSFGTNLLWLVRRIELIFQIVHRGPSDKNSHEGESDEHNRQHTVNR